MISYTREEIVPVTEVARGFSNLLKKLTDGEQTKVAVSKNNKLEAVMLSIDEYERLQTLADLVEHYEIFQKVQERKEQSSFSLDEVEARLGIS